MSTLIVRVCEECGAHSATGDGWLVLEGVQIKSTRTDEQVVRLDEAVDLCSPGCVLRYMSRLLEPAVNGHPATLRAKVDEAAQPIRMFI